MSLLSPALSALETRREALATGVQESRPSKTRQAVTTQFYVINSPRLIFFFGSALRKRPARMLAARRAPVVRARNVRLMHTKSVPRTTQLRNMIAKGHTSFLMEAHRCVPECSKAI